MRNRAHGLAVDGVGRFEEKVMLRIVGVIVLIAIVLAVLMLFGLLDAIF